jgi:hypothetical protein
VATAITRAMVEAEVARDAGALLAFLGEAASAPNPFLSGPIAAALLALGVVPADPSNPVDADFAAIDPARFRTLVRLASYWTIDRALGNVFRPNEQAQDRRQEWGTLVSAFQRRLDSMALELAVYLSVTENPACAATPPLRFPTPRDPSTFGVGPGRWDH